MNVVPQQITRKKIYSHIFKIEEEAMMTFLVTSNIQRIMTKKIYNHKLKIEGEAMMTSPGDIKIPRT